MRLALTLSPNGTIHERPKIASNKTLANVCFWAKADIRFDLRHLTNNLYGSCNFFDGAKAERILHTFDFDNSRFVNTRLRF